MIDFNHNDYEGDINFENYEFESMPYESFQRQRPPFFQDPENDNFPQIGNGPSDFNNPPGFNFPGGAFNPPGMPKSAPPNYIPSKSTAGVQKFSLGGDGVSTTAVSQNSIRFCLYKYTYIWERNGRNYWAFLLNVDRRSVSGFRWTGRNWIYFGVNLRRIDSFVCYRSEINEDCNDCIGGFRENNVPLIDNKKDYSLNQTKDVYTQTLSSINIPEIKEDFVTHTIGYIDDVNVKSDMPCVKIRNVCHRITLEVTYPNNFDQSLKNEINKFATEASTNTCKIFNSSRNNEEYSNSPESFNNSLSLIPEALNNFSNTFNSKLKLLNLSSDDYSNIAYSIRNEKIYNDWKSYFSTL